MGQSINPGIPEFLAFKSSFVSQSRKIGRHGAKWDWGAVSLFVLTSDVSGGELFGRIGGLNKLQHLSVSGGLIRTKIVRRVVVGLAQKIEQFHHAHDLVLREAPL